MRCHVRLRNVNFFDSKSDLDFHDKSSAKKKRSKREKKNLKSRKSLSTSKRRGGET